MARPRKIPARTPDEIQAALGEEGEQLALLRNDLRDALILGESTRSLRDAIAETEKVIASLQTALEDARAATLARRESACKEDATLLLAEASTRHAAILAPLEAPAFPAFIEKDFVHDIAA